VTGEALLSVRDLVVHFDTAAGEVRAVNGVTLDVRAGEAVGLVGESGSGKSVTSLSIMGLLPKPAGRVVSGEILFEGRDLTQASDKALRQLRGKDIAMVFQDPMSSLNPVLTIGEQVEEVVRAHERVGRTAARDRAAGLLGSVGIPRPKEQLGRYPHQFSGGMRQRVMIAMALALRPRLLIADEPTTALDVTIQAQVLELLVELTRDMGTALLLISHDLGIMARVSSRILVMYAGHVVESAPTRELFAHPSHPYTVGLLNSIPAIHDRGKELRPIEGAPPDPERMPEGCPFAPRCRWRVEACWPAMPPIQALAGRPTHEAACHNPVREDEVLGAVPRRPGFVPAPPPSGDASEIPA
jgi:oligopeptide/dipeptide ABC transporter ATP-binding protein